MPATGLLLLLLTTPGPGPARDTTQPGLQPQGRPGKPASAAPSSAPQTAPHVRARPRSRTGSQPSRGPKRGDPSASQPGLTSPGAGLTPAQAFPPPAPQHPVLKARAARGRAARRRALAPLRGGPLASYAALTLAREDPSLQAGLTDPGPHDPWRAEVLQLKAEALAPTEPLQAAALLSRLQTPAPQAQAAALLAQAGRPAQAQALRRQLLLRWPTSPEAAPLRANDAAVDRLLPTRADRLRLAEALLDAHDNPAAAHQLDRLRPGARPQERCALAYLGGKAARKRRRYREALPLLRQARDRCEAQAGASAPRPPGSTAGPTQAQAGARAEAQAGARAPRPPGSTAGPTQAQAGARAQTGASTGTKTAGRASGRLRAQDRRRARAAALLLAQVQAILGQRAALTQTLAWFEAHAPGHRYHDDVLFRLAELEQGPAARARYRQLLKELPSSDHASQAAWRLALHAIQRGQLRSARAQLTAVLSQDGLRPMERERALYWRARSSERGAPGQARADYRALTARPCFYAWLALSELQRRRPGWARPLRRRLLRAAAAPSAPPRAGPGLLERPALVRARAYAAAGLNPAAAQALVGLLSTPGGAPLTPHERLWIAHALLHLGAYPEAQHALRWAGGPGQAALSAQTVGWWRAAYSRPFLTEARAAAQAEGVDPLLLLALAREESTFDPEIVSWAGAIGLTQLMPPTARGAHQAVFKTPLPSLQALRAPALNLRLGARVLAEGRRRFGGVDALALSAYNGGPRLTRRFLPKRGKVRFDRWVESIPVRETRRYIRRVLESYGVYRLLWAQPPATLPLPAHISAR